MRALTLIPGEAGSARLEERPEPGPSPGTALLEVLAVGVCGTDRELLRGDYGRAPDGEARLVLGHECLARVLEAPEGSGLRPGALVVPIVRRPDPVPCPSCALGEWDMCQNGLYTEHGIQRLHGFLAERVRVAADALVPVPPALGAHGVLVEPASVLAKAWDHIEHILSRSQFRPRVVLVTGAGPIGFMAALMARQRGLEVRMLDRTTVGPKPGLARALGARYHVGALSDICPGTDVLIECTGASALVLEAMSHVGPNGIVCLTGVSSGHRRLAVDAAGLGRGLVLENNVVFGTVNANRRHYARAVEALARADPSWLSGLVTRRVPLSRWEEAFEKAPGDVKVVLEPGR